MSKMPARSVSLSATNAMPNFVCASRNKTFVGKMLNKYKKCKNIKTGKNTFKKQKDI